MPHASSGHVWMLSGMRASVAPGAWHQGLRHLCGVGEGGRIGAAGRAGAASNRCRVAGIALVEGGGAGGGRGSRCWLGAKSSCDALGCSSSRCEAERQASVLRCFPGETPPMASLRCLSSHSSSHLFTPMLRVATSASPCIRLLSSSSLAAATTATAAAASISSPSAEVAPEAAFREDAGGAAPLVVTVQSSLPRGKQRLDAFLVQAMAPESRARLQGSIREGNVQVNGVVVRKAGHALRPGDVVSALLPAPPPLSADPEDLSLSIAFEDEHLLVINKPPGMVVHPSPGHSSGTLVNGLLHHCKLPAIRLDAADVDSLSALSLAEGWGWEEEEVALQDGDDNDDDDDDHDDDDDEEEVEKEGEMEGGKEQKGRIGKGTWEERRAAERKDEGKDQWRDNDSGQRGGLTSFSSSSTSSPHSSSTPAIIRPGIVHRLDKGTSGLLVVAKDPISQARLSQQFQNRTVLRSYLSITIGCPSPPSGRIVAAIGRDERDRKKMSVVRGGGGGGSRRNSRHAASRYSVEEVLCGGGAAVVRWRLETGRTHQIRVHSRHISHPIVGDETYGGYAKTASAALCRRLPRGSHSLAQQLMASVDRPMLHARSLGFIHPRTGEELFFEVDPPPDFLHILSALRDLTPPSHPPAA